MMLHHSLNNGGQQIEMYLAVNVDEELKIVKVVWVMEWYALLFKVEKSIFTGIVTQTASDWTKTDVYHKEQEPMQNMLYVDMQCLRRMTTNVSKE